MKEQNNSSHFDTIHRVQILLVAALAMLINAGCSVGFQSAGESASRVSELVRSQSTDHGPYSITLVIMSVSTRPEYKTLFMEEYPFGDESTTRQEADGQLRNDLDQYLVPKAITEFCPSLPKAGYYLRAVARLESVSPEGLKTPANIIASDIDCRPTGTQSRFIGPWSIHLHINRLPIEQQGDNDLYNEIYAFGDANTPIPDLQEQLNRDVITYLLPIARDTICPKLAENQVVYLNAQAFKSGTIPMDSTKAGDTGSVDFVCPSRTGAPTEISNPTTPVPPIPDTPIVSTSETRLEPGKRLIPGDSVFSQDRRTELKYQSDGNLVIYRDGQATWSSGTEGTTPGRTEMQTDGHLVVYDGSNRPVFFTNTDGNGGAYLAVQNDGNVVIYLGEEPNGEGRGALWSAFTGNLIGR